MQNWKNISQEKVEYRNVKEDLIASISYGISIDFNRFEDITQFSVKLTTIYPLKLTSPHLIAFLWLISLAI